MQRGTGAIVAHIGREPCFERRCVDALEIGGLMNEVPAP